MNKLFLAPFVFFSTVALCHAPNGDSDTVSTLEQCMIGATPSATKNDKSAASTHNKPIDQKAIQKLAAMIGGKKSIRHLHGYVSRSEKPIKKLIDELFFQCDFHKDQLIELKQYTMELTELLNASLPSATRMVFMCMSHPQIKEFVDALAHYEVDNETMSSAYFTCLDNMDTYLAQADPALHAVLCAQKVQWQRFHDKWQVFLSNLADYVAARLKVREQYLERPLKNFKRGMIWKHLGPTLGLGIQALWHSRKLKQSDGDDVMIALMQEVYAQIMIHKDMHEKDFVSLAQDAIDTYGALMHEAIDKSLLRVA